MKPKQVIRQARKRRENCRVRKFTWTWNTLSLLVPKELPSREPCFHYQNIFCFKYHMSNCNNYCNKLHRTNSLNSPWWNLSFIPLFILWFLTLYSSFHTLGYKNHLKITHILHLSRINAWMEKKVLCALTCIAESQNGWGIAGGHLAPPLF